MRELEVLDKGHLKLSWEDRKEFFEEELGEQVRSEVKRLLEEALEAEKRGNGEAERRTDGPTERRGNGAMSHERGEEGAEEHAGQKTGRHGEPRSDGKTP